jgi:hypothetical protein
VQFIIWSSGIGASTAPPSSREEIVRRTEVIRLLQTFLSKCIYSQGEDNSPINPWAVEIAIKQDKKAVLGMLCSFINTIGQYDPIGWAKLPYNHLLFADVVEPLVSLCCQTLVALLDFRGGSSASKDVETSLK